MLVLPLAAGVAHTPGSRAHAGAPMPEDLGDAPLPTSPPRVPPTAPVAPSAEGALGRPGQRVSLVARNNAAGAPELLADGARVTGLPYLPTRLEARSVTLPAGTVLLLTTRGEGARTDVLLLVRRGARVTVVDVARTDWTGDPGERTARFLTVIEGGEHPRIVRGRSMERAQVCGSELTPLETQSLDPRTLTWNDEPQDPRGARVPTQTRTATLANAALQGPRLDALRFDVASSGGGEATLERAPRPVAITDRDTGTAWVEAEPSRGSVAFASGRYDASEWPVRTVSLVPVPTGAPAGYAAPEYVDIAAPDGLVRIELPPSPTPGARYAVELDPPVRFRCITVLLPTRADVRGQHVGLAELALHSEFDGEDGATRLIAELAAGGSRGVSAARLLRGLGASGATAIRTAWPDMTAREQRLAVRVLADLAGSEPIAREALLAPARSPDGELREAALEALRAGGAGNELTTLMTEGSDEAAQILARAIPGRALLVLLPALETPGGVARAGLRAAISEALQRAPEDALAVATLWAAEPHAVEASAIVAQALGALGEPGAALGASLLRDAAARATTFEDVWRVTAAAAALPSEAELDAWLRGRVGDDERWMIRTEAATSLHARQSPLAADAARTLAADVFPRARERAASLMAVETDRSLLLTLAQRDPWPRVRAAAIGALASDPEARALMVGALNDPKARVRLAAIEAFRTARDGQAMDAIAQRLARPNELAAVQRAAVRYLGELDAHAHVETLIAVVDRGRQPSAYDPDIETAVLAVSVLGRLGGPRATEYLVSLRDGGPPEAIQAAAARALGAGRAPGGATP
ncbi:MAG: HEAT repeat domain-containing protein [Sandaracinaceae bacterium]|nr:HEAT repeat domain-containing protein [Sandaracinaceae bacterium]